MDIKNHFLSEICQKIYKKTHDGILITDKNGTILKCNPAISKITGYSREELIGKNPSILKSNQHSTNFYRQMFNNVLSRGSWEGKIINRHKSGS